MQEFERLLVEVKSRIAKEMAPCRPSPSVVKKFTHLSYAQIYDKMRMVCQRQKMPEKAQEYKHLSEQHNLVYEEMARVVEMEDQAAHKAHLLRREQLTGSSTAIEEEPINNNLYSKFLERCLGESLSNCAPVMLTGGEVVEVLWPLNDRFHHNYHQIANLPYEASFEKEADDAIVAYVFYNDYWMTLSAQAWRVLLERQQQCIILFQLKENEPIIPIPENLQPQHYLGGCPRIGLSNEQPLLGFGEI